MNGQGQLFAQALGGSRPGNEALEQSPGRRLPRLAAKARAAWQIGRATPALGFGAVVLLVLAGLSILAPWIAPYSPEYQDPALRLATPNSTYWLGGDSFGRDIFSRLLYAVRISLEIAVASMAITLVIGTLLGAFAGFYGRWVDRILMRFTDLVDIFPTFFLLILVAAMFDGGAGLLIVMIGITSWPTNARVIRAQMISLRDRDFVVAAQVIGVRNARIVIRHLVPQLAPIMIASATVRVSSNIMTETGLSFLGLGIMPPTPSLGNMIAEADNFLSSHWWQTGIPGVTILILVLAFNLLGEGLRDHLDPQTRSRA